MKKPQLCLAFTLSLALLQANLLQANASPSSPAIWEQLAGVSKSTAPAKSTKPAVKAAKSTAAVKAAPLSVSSSPSAGLYTASSVARGASSDGQVILLFGKDKSATAAQAPAAALTIHSTLPETEPAKELVEAPVAKPTLVAMSNSVVSDAKASVPTMSEISQAGMAEDMVGNDKQLLAQLAPDQIIAQSETATTPIPPVVTGTVDLEEFKPSNTIDLKVSQSRTFKMRNKIVRTSISDPAIAEPVVVAENQLVLLGKAPGGATLVLWDDAGNSMAVDLRVSRDFTQLQSMLREIDPRIIVKPFSAGGTDRVILMGDVDHSESIIRAFAIANAFMDDRGMVITVANSRILGTRIGEQAGGGGGGAGGGGGGALSTIGNVDRYTFFGNQNNNIAKAQTIISDGGRVTSLISVRKCPLIVLHVTFMEMNSSAVRELGLQLGVNFTSQSFGFSIGGGTPLSGSATQTQLLQSIPGVNGTYGTFINPAIGGTATNFSGLSGITGGGGPGVNFLTPIAPVAPLSQALQTGVNALTGAPNAFTNFGPFGGSPGFFNPSFPGFVAPGINPQFGASTQPVFFQNGLGPTALGLSQLASVAFQNNLFGTPGGATFNQGSLMNMFNAISNFASGNSSRWSVNPAVQGIIGYQRARVLAEPTLVAMSGERASFLAGGEIPIIQSVATAGTAAQSVVFEPYGLRINMIPVLLEDGSINLQVSPEERLLDRTISFLPSGSTGTGIPGFTTRKVQTTVELKPGQELFISGLISNNSARILAKTPLLGEVPVLGALYKSKQFNKNESELIVAVRPEVILPGSPGQLKVPAELSKYEAHRDLNVFQVEPSTLNEKHYTGGMSEQRMNIPGELPAGAPIPDSGKK